MLATAVTPAAVLSFAVAMQLNCSVFCVWGGIITFLSVTKEAMTPDECLKTVLALNVLLLSIARWDSKMKDFEFGK